MFNVLFAASEASPYIQTGGLAEVAGSLPRALAAEGCNVRLVLPAYRTLKTGGLRVIGTSFLTLSGWSSPSLVQRLHVGPRIELCLVHRPEFFDRPGGPYADDRGKPWPDNPERFSFFSHAVSALAMHIGEDGWRTQIVHANDWQTAVVPLLLHDQPQRPGTLFTIHNLAYRGLCDYAAFTRLHLPASSWHYEGLEFYGQCALIKGGLVYADRLTTVSPTYAREIQEPLFGEGLEGVLKVRSHALTGIMNGIDVDVWDPTCDPVLAANYDATNLGSKQANKHALQTFFGLPVRADRFLIGSVSRFVAQKGIDLLLEAIPTLLRYPIQVVFLGSGDRDLEARIQTMAAAYPEQVAVKIGFDVDLSHQMFAGLDAFAMPSRFEPCGLAQMYSQRYGTVPIVHRTGGLADSVFDAEDTARGTGFVFDDISPQGLEHAIWRALQVFNKPAYWQQLQRKGMACDFSWTQSAESYMKLYREMRGR